MITFNRQVNNPSPQDTAAMDKVEEFVKEKLKAFSNETIPVTIRRKGINLTFEVDPNSLSPQLRSSIQEALKLP